MVSTPILDRFIYDFGVANELGIRNFLEQRQFARPERVYPEIVSAYLASAQKPLAEYSALSFVRGDLCFDLSQYIEQLTVPTAIIWGQKSQFTGPDIGRRLVQMNPTAIKAFLVIEEVGLTPQRRTTCGHYRFDSPIFKLRTCLNLTGAHSLVLVDGYSLVNRLIIAIISQININIVNTLIMALSSCCKLL